MLLFLDSGAVRTFCKKYAGVDGERLTPLEAVSYTHLDVYKRQVSRHVSMITFSTLFPTAG